MMNQIWMATAVMMAIYSGTAAFANARVDSTGAQAGRAKIRVACIGASITFGHGIPDREKNCYPAQMQNLLGTGYEVRNYGVSGRTMLKHGDAPYWKEEAYRQALEFNPNVVVIDLGGNDSKPENWQFKAEFADDTRAMIASFRVLPAKPRVLLCLPMPAFKTTFGINDEVIVREQTPILRQVAFETATELVDLHTAFLDKRSWFADNIHPNAEGAALMAKIIGGVIGFEAARADSAKLLRDMVLWYRQPAEKWTESMPLGNGMIGARMFGGVQKERIALNESSFWSGRPHDYDNPEAGKYFPQIRDLVSAGRFQEAEKLADAHFFGVPAAQQAFQPLGDLLLSFDGMEAVEDYSRELDMETSVATVRFRVGDAIFTREVFVSYPDRVLVVRITSDRPGRVSLAASLQSPYLDRTEARANRLTMEGTWKGPIPIPNGLIASVDGKGLRFQTALAASQEGGKVEDLEGSLRIQGANSVTLILTAATSYVNYHDIGGDPAALCAKTLANATRKSYALLRRRHEDDFAGLMGRLHLDAGGQAQNAQPTDARIDAVRAGKRDPNLEALCFQFGRYILASSSRAGGQPANLQGIWNESVSPSWGSKYTININTEMNYWPAEVCNLAECHQPLFDMLQDISVTGSKTARIYYGHGGWVAHHNIDLWRGTAPVDAARFGMWPVGGAWLCQDLWEHYAYSGDRKFLKKYYPVMKGSAQFLLELLVEDPAHHWLVTPFSMSPEHGYMDRAGKLAFLSPAPTMDVAILRELFTHCIEAGRILGVDRDFGARLEAALKRLPPYQVGARGYLQEWIEDWQPGSQGHNLSPNFTFYPGSSITLRGTPELAGAIRKWMETRNSRGGFPLVWDIAVWARLERGEKVAAGMQTYLRNCAAPNLHNSGSNQSDASFGYTAAVAEALLQSHAGDISLLPALPEGWSDGSVRGLRARGGLVVDLSWKGGKLTSAEIHNFGGEATFTVRNGEKVRMLSIKSGASVRLKGDLNLANY
jgi:alpha-L-fucosidase 2